MKPCKIACIFGTRPEVIKMAPVILALQSMPEQVRVEVISTGQHREMLIPLIKWFGLNVTKNMDLMHHNQRLNELTGRLVHQLGQCFNSSSYDLVIGQGDTTTVFAAALAAFHEQIPFAHVEAGLRTFDRNLPFPEEMNRVLVGRLANIHFAPTTIAVQNLRKEGILEQNIFMTGNTVIDALQYTVRRLQQENQTVILKEKTIFVTAHRRENFGAPLKSICRGIRRILEAFPEANFVFSVHPNPNVREVVYEILGDAPQVKLVEPMSYPELVAYVQACYIILTDSGGLQEEAPFLGKPVLILREETERPEVVNLGGATLVGSDEENISHWVMKLLLNKEVYQKMVLGYSPYGDGAAGKQIAEKLVTLLKL